VNRKELQIKTVLACGQSFRYKTFLILTLMTASRNFINGFKFLFVLGGRTNQIIIRRSGRGSLLTTFGA